MSGTATRWLASEYGVSAGVYERHWAPVIGPMARGLLGALPLGSARRVVEIGCGTGWFRAELRERAPTARLTGVDRSEGMLRRAPSAAAGRVALMDAQRLALADGCCDVALMVFMLFHLPEPGRGLAEARRVLRPGGSLGVATWGHSPDEAWTTIWNEELDASGAGDDVRDPSVAQHESMDDEAKLSGLLQAAGLEPARVWSETHEHRWTVEGLLTCHAAFGRLSRRAATLPTASRESCQAVIAERLAALPPEQLVAHEQVLLAHAVRRD